MVIIIYFAAMNQATTSLITDPKVIDQFRRGDKNAFDQLYKRYAPAIFGVISRLIKDKKNAELALQQTFITIWQQRAMYQSAESFLAWALGIVKKVVPSFAGIEENFAQPENQTSPGNVYEHTEQPSGVTEVAREKEYFLQDKALQLMYLYGKSPQEVAKYLNISPEQVAREVRCAINRKRKQLS
jgi:RNA polymerase sigma factor (sigma-70 family)